MWCLKGAVHAPVFHSLHICRLSQASRGLRGSKYVGSFLLHIVDSLDNSCTLVYLNAHSMHPFASKLSLSSLPAHRLKQHFHVAFLPTFVSLFRPFIDRELALAVRLPYVRDSPEPTN
jgi:hypothetical protein